MKPHARSAISRCDRRWVALIDRGHEARPRYLIRRASAFAENGEWRELALSEAIASSIAASLAEALGVSLFHVIHGGASDDVIGIHHLTKGSEDADPLDRVPGALLYQARSLDEYGAILAAIFNTHAARKSDKFPWLPSRR